MTKDSQVTAAVQAAVDNFGSLDVMFNHAGIYRGGKLMINLRSRTSTSPSTSMLKAHFCGTQAAVRQCPKARAKLRDWPARRHCQSGVDCRSAGPSQTVRLQHLERRSGKFDPLRRHRVRPEGIRVNGICPTYAKTALTRDLRDNMDFMRTFADSVPLKRWGGMTDAARLALYLAGDESSYVH